MKRLLYLLTMCVFVLLAQNASAQMPPATTGLMHDPVAGPDFEQCKQMKPRGDFALMKEKKNCMRDLARSLMDGPGMPPGPGGPNHPPGPGGPGIPLGTNP